MRKISIGIVLVALFPVSAVQAETNAGSSFRMSAQVPEYCEISASAIQVAEGDGVATGSVFESCNTQQGFQVVAAHRTLGANERIDFSYAGVVRQLQSHGWSEVANRPGARYGLRPISVRYTSLESPLAINLTITAF